MCVYTESNNDTQKVLLEKAQRDGFRLLARVIHHSNEVQVNSIYLYKIGLRYINRCNYFSINSQFNSIRFRFDKQAERKLNYD